MNSLHPFVVVYDENQSLSAGFWKAGFSESVTVLTKGSAVTNRESESPFPPYLQKSVIVSGHESTSSLHTAFNIFFLSISAHQLEYHI